MRPRDLGVRAALPAVIAILTVLAYAPAWRFPFIQDDIGLFNWIGGRGLPELWSSSPFGYYRPLTQTIWKLGEIVAGRFDPVMLHGVNFAAHILNALLVGYLASRWLPERARRRGLWLAASIFALYPFTFQVVPFVGALYHPFVSVLILGALAAHEAHRARSDSDFSPRSLRLGGELSSIYPIVSLACAALAPFAHEAGLMAGPLLALAELASARSQRRRLDRPIVIGALFAAALGLAAWLVAPKLGPQTARPDASGILINLSYAWQGLIYPLGPLTQSIVAGGASDQVVLWLGGVLFVILVSCAALRAGYLRLLFFGLVLWMAGALPFSVALVPRYVLAAAWLLYEQSIGVALVWTAGLLSLADAAGSRRRVRGALAVAVALALLVFGVWFIRTRIAYYDRLSDSVWSLAETLRARPADRVALVINFPRLARPLDRVFPIGVESPQFYARAANLRDVLAANGVEPPGEVMALTFGNLIPPLDYSIETMGDAVDWPALASAIASADGVYRSYPESDRIPIRYAGRLMPPASSAPLVRFGELAALLTADAAWVEDGLLAVTLGWQYRGGADQAVVFVHALGADGELIAQSDGPVMDMLPFWQWPAGAQVEEVRYLKLRGASVVRVQVGLYDPGNGLRLPPIDAEGRSYADGAVPLFEVDAATAESRRLLRP